MPHDPYLLATDLDGTVIPPEPGPERFREIADLRNALEGRGDITLAYVTGRHLELALEGIADFGLPDPAFVACDVGTSIYEATQEEGRPFRPVEEYGREMRRAMEGGSGEDIRRRLEGLAGMELQEEEKQAEFKVSYYLDGAPVEDLSGTAAALLDSAGIPVKVVWSVDPVSGRGLLDVLPAGVAKDRAVAFLQRYLGVEADAVLYAGDSGNDRAAFLAGYPAVIVGNAPDSLKARVVSAAEERGIAHRVYLAESSYAAGVVEGGRHFGLF